MSQQQRQTMQQLYALTQKWTPFSVMMIILLLAMLAYGGYDIVVLGMVPEWLTFVLGAFLGGSGTMVSAQTMAHAHGALLQAALNGTKENSTNG